MQSSFFFKIFIFFDVFIVVFQKKIVILQYVQPKSCVIMDNAKPLNRIKVMLAERMVSNKELTEMLGKNPVTVSKWVTKTSQPSLENLIEIARCF